MFYIAAGTDNSYDAKRVGVFVLESAVVNTTSNTTIPKKKKKKREHCPFKWIALLPKYVKYLRAWTHFSPHILPCHLLPFPSVLGYTALPASPGSRHITPHESTVSARAAALPFAGSTGHENPLPQKTTVCNQRSYHQGAVCFSEWKHAVISKYSRGLSPTSLQS